jgi:hypothetical protein
MVGSIAAMVVISGIGFLMAHALGIDTARVGRGHRLRVRQRPLIARYAWPAGRVDQSARLPRR